MNKKEIFNKKKKKEVADFLYSISDSTVDNIKKILREQGVDTSKIKVIDRSRYLIKYIPEVVEQLSKKYGTEKILLDDSDIKKEALNLIQEKFQNELKEKEVKSWSIYYILTHCKVPSTINLNENIQLIPFGGLQCNDYIEVIESVMRNFGPLASQYSEKNMVKFKEMFQNMYRGKNPVSILAINNIHSETIDGVYQLTKEYAESVMLCFSNIINSSIETSGWIVVAHLEGFKEVYPSIYFHHYNLMYPETKKIEKISKKIIQKIDGNESLRIILKLEKEALFEEQEKFRLLKRWMILELVSEEFYNASNDIDLLSNDEKNSIKNFILDKIKMKSNYVGSMDKRIEGLIGQINYKNIKEKVRAFLLHIQYEIPKFDEIDKDIIDLVYQTRNCIAHNGKCCKDNINTACKCSRKIKEFRLTIKDYNQILGLMILKIIGYFSGIEFQYKKGIPQNIKQEWDIKE